MALEILPPSPNWYLPSSSSCSEDGILAFATKSSVLLLNVTVSPPTFVGNLSGHTERATSVAFCRKISDGGTWLCATAGDDGFIKLWDIKSKSLVSEKKCQENKITSLDWSRANTDVVVAGDEKGCLIYWNIKSSKKDDAKLLRPEKGYIYSLACSPHNDRLVALGYKDGKILIVDALSKKNPIMHHLRGHNDEVQSLTWAPYLGEDAFLKNKPEDGGSELPVEPGCLLASGSRDKTIRMWSTGQGKLLKVMNLPPRGGGGQRPRDRGDEGMMKSRVWVSLSWPQDRPMQLVSSSHGGDVILWDLSKPSQPRWEILGAPGDSGHQRSVFNLTGSHGDPDRVFTTSLDRQVICWNLSTLRSEWCIPTLGGFVYSIVPSPLDPARLAVGVGDNMIRVWNTGARNRCYDVITLWQSIKSKVTVVSWHPTRENTLAYGADDGRVGIFNVSITNKPPQQFWTYHKKTIYSLCWGPPCPKPDGSHCQSHHIYSCGGEGIIYQHNPAKLDQESTNINNLIKKTNNYKHLLPQRSDVAWRLDGRAVAIGNEDGSVEVFASPDLRHLCTIHVQSKIINCLSWYPDFEDTVQSEPLKFESNQSNDTVLSKPVEATELVASGDAGRGHGDEACASVDGEPASSSSETGVGLSGETNDAMSEKNGAGQTQETSECFSEKTDASQSKETGECSSEHTNDDSSEKTSAKPERNRSEKRYWLASGSNDHEVEVYDLESVLGVGGKSLTVPITSSYCTLSGHSGRVTSLAWSPHGDGRLVSTSYDNSAQVWDVEKGEPVANFRGHMGRVFSCAWSCFDPDVIMTGGEDFCLMKWQVSKVNHVKPPKTGKKPFKRAGKKGKKPSQQKSRTNQEEHIDGNLATDSSVLDKEKEREVDMATAHAEVSDPAAVDHKEAGTANGREGMEDAKELLEKKKRELLAQVEEIEGRIDRTKEFHDGECEDEEVSTAELSISEANKQESCGRERNDALEAILDRLLPKEDVDKDHDKATSFKDMTIPGTKKGRHKRYKSLFPACCSQDNQGKAFLQQNCIDLAKHKQGHSTDENSDDTPLHLGLFVDRKMTMKMLNDEACQHGESGNYDQRNQLNLWKGNILQPLREAIKKGQLTDWLVAMAPLAGHDVWLQTCNAFARHLESQDHIHRAVNFYLISHQVYKAIALLKKNSMFRDAITLAQVRLLPSDPVLHDLYLTWASQLEANNSYEPAARCYLAVNQPVNAIKLLARKGDVAALRTALHVAILSDCMEEGLVVSIAIRLLNLCLATGQWKQAFDVFSLDKRYVVHASLVLVYEVLVWCLIHQGYLTPNHDIHHTDIFAEISSDIQWNDSSNDDCTWSIPTLSGTSLVEAVLTRAGLSCDPSDDQQCLKDDISHDLVHDVNKVLRYASQLILLGQSSDQSEVKMGHVAEALNLCHTSGHPTIALGILQITAAQGSETLTLSPNDEADISKELLCWRMQYRLTQLYHIRTKLQAGRSLGHLAKDRGKELYTADDVNDLTGTPRDVSQVKDVVKEGDNEEPDDEGGIAFNPRTEGYLFPCAVPKDASWSVCVSDSSSSPAGIQNLTREQMADRLLCMIGRTYLGDPPSQVLNKGCERLGNGAGRASGSQDDHSDKLSLPSDTSSCLEGHSDKLPIPSDTSISLENHSDKLPIRSEALCADISKEAAVAEAVRTSNQEVPSEASNDRRGRSLGQSPPPTANDECETERNEPNISQTMEPHPTDSAVHEVILLASVKKVLLVEHYSVVSALYAKFTPNPAPEIVGETCKQELTAKESIGSKVVTNGEFEHSSMSDGVSRGMAEDVTNTTQSHN